MRTREHWLADLSVNHVERLILLQGHTVERVQHDYGYDLIMRTFDYENDTARLRGAAEAGHVYFQLKATLNMRLIDKGATIAQSIERRHLMLWQEEIMPVIIVVCDALEECAYWLSVQGDLGEVVALDGQRVITAHLSRQSVLDEAAIETIRQIKSRDSSDYRRRR